MKWINYKKQSPPNSLYYLVMIKMRVTNGEWVYFMKVDPYYVKEGNFLCELDGLYEVTHWMELPEKPSDK